MARKKVTVVGAGNVGATTAQRLAELELSDVVLVDIVDDMPLGKALDLAQSGPIYGYDTTIVGSNDYEATEGSDIVIVTAGIPRTPGMSRDDLLKTNVDIIKGVVDKVIVGSPNAIIIMVANPLDAMCYVALKSSGFPREQNHPWALMRPVWVGFMSTYWSQTVWICLSYERSRIGTCGTSSRRCPGCRRLPRLAASKDNIRSRWIQSG